MMKRASYLLVFALFLCGCSDGQIVKIEGKIKGMNYTGPGRGPFGEEPFTSMVAIGSNFVAFVPEATLYQNTLKIRHMYEGDRSWYGETTEGTLEGLMQARKMGLKVMIKPHIQPGIDLSGWNRERPERSDTAAWRNYFQERREYVESLDLKTRARADWRGDLAAKDEESWELIASAYEEFILSYAMLADSMDVEIFCIGTELKAMALEKPDYWIGLIGKVRQVYKGKLTYAANWDGFDQISFWDHLDFIGIDAYFPLGDYQVPTVKETVEEWAKYKTQIQRLQERVKKPIIFTEWGYESEEYAGKTPWKSDGVYNEQVQVNLYEGTFQSFWDEPWFQGVFIWRWSPKDEFGRGSYNFSPKDSPTEKVLEKWFRD